MKTRMFNIIPISRFLGLVAALGVAVSTAGAKTISVPAGSINALSAAIASAGPGGTVILQSGLHQESQEVLVPFAVNVIGQPGAVLETATSPATAFPLVVIAALHFKNAPGATVQGISFRPPAGTIANCAVILENSPGAQVLHNQITGLQYGVFIQGSDNAVVRGNVIDVTLAWAAAENPLPDGEGILANAGHHVLVIDNTVSDGVIGIFVSDRYGELLGNVLSNNLQGVQACHNYDTSDLAPPGDLFYYAFSDLIPHYGPEPATGWQLHGNTARGNAWGLLVIDGSHENVLANNDASGNGDPAVWGFRGYDIELGGLSTGTVPLAAAHDNLVIAGADAGIVVKDCGTADVILGKVNLADPSVDPCSNGF